MQVNSGQGSLTREIPEMGDPKSDLGSGSKGSSRGTGSGKVSSPGKCEVPVLARAAASMVAKGA